MDDPTEQALAGAIVRLARSRARERLAERGVTGVDLGGAARDHDLAPRLRANARRMVVEEFSQARMIARYAALYEGLARVHYPEQFPAGEDADGRGSLPPAVYPVGPDGERDAAAFGGYPGGALSDEQWEAFTEGW